MSILRVIEIHINSIRTYDTKTFELILSNSKLKVGGKERDAHEGDGERE